MAITGEHSGALSLVLGVANHHVADAARYLVAYRHDSGYAYLDHEPCTPPDQVVLEDLGPTTLVNARFGTAAALAVVRHGASLDLSTLPACALESTSEDERQRVAELVATVARWRGFGTSTATKVLHKKRPALIPILDNQAIFGAYLDPRWPGRPSGQDSVYGADVVQAALDHLVVDLTRPENRVAWQGLAHMEPDRSRIELFDMVWWMYFRDLEPVPRAATQGGAAVVATRADEPAASVSVPAVGPANQATATPAGEVTRFQDDDNGYQQWLGGHASGFVLNCERRPRAGNLKLHRATCSFINGTPPNGRTWTGPYVKVCALEAQVLADWARQATGASPARCPMCGP